MVARFFASLCASLTALSLSPPSVAATPPATVPTLVDTRGLECTGSDREVRRIVIDFTGGRWREAGDEWSKIVHQDDATITLVKEGGLLSGMQRLERLDRATLILSTELHTGLINQKLDYRCKIVRPFDADRQL